MVLKHLKLPENHVKTNLLFFFKGSGQYQRKGCRDHFLLNQDEISVHTANLGFLCTNKKIPRVKLNFLKTFFCTKNAIFLLYCDCLNCSLRNQLVKYGNQCILHEKKVFQNIVLILSIFLLVHRDLKFAVCTLISLWMMRKSSWHPLR